MNDYLVIVYAVVLVAIVGAFLCYKAYHNKQEAKFLLEEFLEMNVNAITDVMIKTLEEKDPTSYISLDEFTADATKAMYDESWKFIEEKIKESYSDESNRYGNLLRLINKELVESFIKTILEDSTIKEKIAEVFEIAMKIRLEEIAEQEKKEAEIAEKYESGEIDTVEYNGEHDLSEFEIGRLNNPEPEIPESVDYDTEHDDTVEVVAETSIDVDELNNILNGDDDEEE